MLAPTEKDTIFRDGTAQLYRFRRSSPAEAELPLLIVPSMINRWYVVDLRKKASLAAALTNAGLDTFCLDWGIPNDEDRYLTWDDVIERLHRAIRAVKRATRAPKVGVLGYCMGSTLSGICAALHPSDVAAFINLAGPFDFARGGLLRTLVDPEWFDVDAISAAGNLSAPQMQGGLVALRPTAQVGKWVSFLDRASDPEARESFSALEAWAGDNIPFPASAYQTYIKELYQQNLLVQGKHYVRGDRVDLANIRCPVLTVAAERDTICPLDAAKGLNDACGSRDKELLVVPGGHVGAVIGSKAPKVLYPAMATWLKQRLGARAVVHEQESTCN